MNAFEDGRLVEARALEMVLPFIGAVAMDGRYVVTDKGRLAPLLQLRAGDALFNSTKGDVVGVEIKGEETERTGNLFLEIWSNKHRWRQGWLYHLQTDLLLYAFLDTRALYVVSFHRLREWAFTTPGMRGPDYPGRIWDYPEREQRKRMQLNDTWGRCVPISVLMKEVGMRRYLIPEAAAA